MDINYGKYINKKFSINLARFKAMKKLLSSTLLAITVSLFVTNGFAGSIRGAGAGTCGEWVESRKTVNDWSGTLHWIQGFISSYNYFSYKGKNPDALYEGITHQSIAVWMDNYCQQHPLHNIATGAVGLVNELKARK